MRFTSFEVNDVLIRTKGSAGILTAVVRSTAVRDGVEIKTHARQLAILSKENERINNFPFSINEHSRSQVSEIPCGGAFPTRQRAMHTRLVRPWLRAAAKSSRITAHGLCQNPTFSI